MRSCIHVACDGHDQSYYSYNSNSDYPPSSISITNAEKIFYINSSPSFLSEATMIYNFDEKENMYKFAYKSKKSVNYYEGFSLYLFYNDDLNNPFHNEYCVDFIHCEPNWVKDGITSKDVYMKLQQSDDWFQPDGSINKDIIINNTRTIAVIIDKLLKIKTDGLIKSIGITSRKLKIDELQNVLKIVLKSLPVDLSNQYSFNGKAGSDIIGIDIYCTKETIDKDLNQFNIMVNLDDTNRYSNYQFDNKYAEYLDFTSSFCTTAFFDEIDIESYNEQSPIEIAISIIKQLNDKAADYIVYKKYANKDLSNDELTEFMQDLQIYHSNKKIEEIAHQNAYMIFFSSKFFSVNKNNKKFFERYLLKNDTVTVEILENIINSANIVHKKEYLQFLLEYQKKDISNEIKIAIDSYLNKDNNVVGENKLHQVAIIVDKIISMLEQHTSLAIKTRGASDIFDKIKIVYSGLNCIPKEFRNISVEINVAGNILLSSKNSLKNEELSIDEESNYEFENIYGQFINMSYSNFQLILEMQIKSINDLNRIAQQIILNEVALKEINDITEKDVALYLKFDKKNIDEKMRELYITLSYKLWFSNYFYTLNDKAQVDNQLKDFLNDKPEIQIETLIDDDTIVEILEKDENNKFFSFLIDYCLKEHLKKYIEPILYGNKVEKIEEKFIELWKKSPNIDLIHYIVHYESIPDPILNYIKLRFAKSSNAEFIEFYLQLSNEYNKNNRNITYESTYVLFENREFDCIDNFLKLLYQDDKIHINNFLEVKDRSSNDHVNRILLLFLGKFERYLEKKFYGQGKSRLFDQKDLDNLDKISKILNYEMNADYLNTRKEIKAEIGKQKEERYVQRMIESAEFRIENFYLNLPIDCDDEEKLIKWLEMSHKDRKDGKTGSKNDTGGKPMLFAISGIIDLVLIFLLFCLFEFVVIPRFSVHGLHTLVIENSGMFNLVYAVVFTGGVIVIHSVYFFIASSNGAYKHYIKSAVFSTLEYIIIISLTYIGILYGFLIWNWW